MIAVVKDLFFVARIRETARLMSVPLVFARAPEEVQAALTGPTRLVLLDLTAGFDYARLFTVLEAASPKPPVFAFTTHALAHQTRPLHERCERVMTKETLTQELPVLLKEGTAA